MYKLILHAIWSCVLLLCALSLHGCGNDPEPGPLCPQPDVAAPRLDRPLRSRGQESFTPMAWSEAQSMANKMLVNMTDCDKYWIMQGLGWENRSDPKWGWYVGNTPSIPHLGIPSLNMNDAAGGFRTIWNELVGTVTCFPSLLAAAATWDPAGVEKLGVALGREFDGKGANGILGPSINLHRVARSGRNFEYLSAEDPYLGSKLTAAYVKGVQSQGIFTVMKHWALNNQETNRDIESSDADQRTKQELYYPPFKSAIDAGATATMCSYNKLNGTYSCSNEHELSMLKETLGFQGFVQSDWWATHNTTVLAGLDQEMPGAPTQSLFSPESLAAVNSPSAIDESARRILTVMYRMRLFDSTRCTPPNCEEYVFANVTSNEHAALARDSAAESIVLLKNSGILPIDPATVTSIAVVGSAAMAKPYNPAAPNSTWNQGDYYSGGGSGHVTPGYVVNPLDGIRNRANAAGITNVQYANDTISTAVALAKQVDLTIVVCGATSGEAEDRANLTLDNDCDALIKAITENATNVVVIAMLPGAVLMPWRDSPDAIAVMFLGGQEMGNAWADVLFGDRAPAGRLPIMIPETENDTIAPTENLTVIYSERLETSYRNKAFKAAYPFGHGLTYTAFTYSDASISPCSDSLCLSFSVSNTGTVAAKAVPQLYLEFPKSVDHPVPFLKGFQKTSLIAPGDLTPVTFVLGSKELSFYNSSTGGWATCSNYTAHIAESSADFKLSVPFQLSATPTLPARGALSDSTTRYKDLDRIHRASRSEVAIV